MPFITINNRKIGTGTPCYIIAELSANHRQDYATAVELVKAARDAGADAVKLQTYTPDTLTIDVSSASFTHSEESIWAGQKLYQLYEKAYTPWEWQPKLKQLADEISIDLFSSPFDHTAVNFLEKMDVPAYKIASFEIVDIPLIKKVAATGKPLILSTGMATIDEIEDALNAARQAGATQIALLKCCSAYPAPASDMNLRTICDMAQRFQVPIGLSDHTLGWDVPVCAVGLGACIIEKHLTLNRRDHSPDAAFSLEPAEFKKLVQAVRDTEQILGTVHYGPLPSERESLKFRRSLFVVEDIKTGDELTLGNIRSIRPATGLPPAELTNVLGKRARKNLKKGTPLCKEDIL